MHKLLAALAATTVLGACARKNAAPPPRADRVGSNTVVVTQEDDAPHQASRRETGRWVYTARTPGSVGAFRRGPGTPPLGAGSFEISTPGDGDQHTRFIVDHRGARLADIDAMGYSTYRSAGKAHHVAGINLHADMNGAAPGGYAMLVYEPAYNPGQGKVASGRWQRWDAYEGGAAVWWSTRDIPGVCAWTCRASWDRIVSANPDAVIDVGFGVNQGGGNPGLTTAIDALIVGVRGNRVTYDLDPFASQPPRARAAAAGQ